MSTVKVEPTEDHPVPFDLSDDEPLTARDEMVVAANTVELQEALGAELDLDESTHEQELLDAIAEVSKSKEITKPNTAFAAAAFLRTYGEKLALDTAEARAAITNKLMEIANCGDTRFELKALELLGKHSDIGIFTQRSELTIKYDSPEALEKAIKERVKRLLNADVIDITPLGKDLDEELGVLEEPEEDDMLSLRPDEDDGAMDDPALTHVEEDDDLDL